MSEKYYDLNVVYQPSLAQNIENLKQLTKLGYSIVALNRIFLPPNKTKLVKDTEYESLAPTIELLEKSLDEDAELRALKLKPVKILSRITIPVSEVSHFGIMKNSYYRKALKDTDLVAITPGNERILKMIAENKTTCDIIALYLEERLDFIPKFKTVREAVENGISWEICYSPAIRSNASRKYTFRYGVDIVERTKHGKGIILSSGGDHMMDFRSPHDILNLANLFMLKGDQRSKAITTNPRSTIKFSETRMFTTYNAVIVEKIEEDEVEDIAGPAFEDVQPSKKKRKKRR